MESCYCHWLTRMIKYRSSNVQPSAQIVKLLITYAKGVYEYLLGHTSHLQSTDSVYSTWGHTTQPIQLLYR